MTQSGHNFTTSGCRSTNLLACCHLPKKTGPAFRFCSHPSDHTQLNPQIFRPVTGCSPSRTTRYRHRHRRLLRRSDAFSTSARGHRRPWKICSPKPKRGTMWLFHCALGMETWIRLDSIRRGSPEKNWELHHHEMGSTNEG